jgi:hypothetical protein
MISKLGVSLNTGVKLDQRIEMTPTKSKKGEPVIKFRILFPITHSATGEKRTRWTEVFLGTDTVCYLLGFFDSFKKEATIARLRGEIEQVTTSKKATVLRVFPTSEKKIVAL